jgi:hypothetical protein
MKTAVVLALLAFFWPFSGGKTYHMSASSSVPAASGTVKVEQSHDNTKLDVKVTHLAKPSDLVPAATVYIVWVQPRGKAAIKKGSIYVDSDLNGEAKVVTTSKNFEVFITPEQSPTVTAPTQAEVMKTHVTVH